MFENNKGVIRDCKTQGLKIQCNGQKKNDKKTNNDLYLQSTTHNTKD